MEHPRHIVCLRQVSNGWTISCTLNEAFRRHGDKIRRCPVLIKRIAERCRNIFMFSGFRLPWLSIKFGEAGPTIACEGNGCVVYPYGNHYCDHNIDTHNQAFCLSLCLQAAMDEIDNVLDFWERGHEDGLTEGPEIDPESRFAKESPYRFCRVSVSYPTEKVLDRLFYLWTNTPGEEQQHLEWQLNLFRGEVHPAEEVFGGPPLILIRKPD